MPRRQERRRMTSTNITHDALGFNVDVPLVIPAGTGRTHTLARIAAMLRGERAANAALPAKISKSIKGSAAANAAPPDGLLTPAAVARKLGCSEKTLRAHVATGDLRYVSIGKGTKRRRMMFTPADLDEFIANRTRKDLPCPSTRTETVARRISTSTSNCEVIGFTARRNARRAAKPKK
jgi:hypothetical protein